MSGLFTTNNKVKNVTLKGESPESLGLDFLGYKVNVGVGSTGQYQALQKLKDNMSPYEEYQFLQATGVNPRRISPDLRDKLKSLDVGDSLELLVTAQELETLGNLGDPMDLNIYPTLRVEGYSKEYALSQETIDTLKSGTVSTKTFNEYLNKIADLEEESIRETNVTLGEFSGGTRLKSGELLGPILQETGEFLADKGIPQQRIDTILGQASGNQNISRRVNKGIRNPELDRTFLGSFGGSPVFKRTLLGG